MIGIGRDDIRAAVGAGMISEAQAASLIALSDSRKEVREGTTRQDEPFELFRGFNEIFIVVGLIVLAVGWTGILGSMSLSWMGDYDGFVIRSAAITMIVLWLLSEYFVRRRRMVAPSILLTGFWAANAAIGMFFALSEPLMVAQGDLSSLPIPIASTTLLILAFWWRFRVPVALTGVALGIFATAIAAAIGAGDRITSARDLFLLSGEGSIAWITLALGLTVFAVAMVFDMSDPHRVTRRSANGFWLHIIAAPAIVNTVALTLLTDGSTRLLLGLFLAFIALTAIVIDRRSFLIAAVGYVVALSESLNTGMGEAGWTILILGVAVLLAGSFWERIRARILNTFSFLLPLDKLPPAY